MIASMSRPVVLTVCRPTVKEIPDDFVGEFANDSLCSLLLSGGQSSGSKLAQCAALGASDSTRSASSKAWRSEPDDIVDDVFSSTGVDAAMRQCEWPFIVIRDLLVIRFKKRLGAQFAREVSGARSGAPRRFGFSFAARLYCPAIPQRCGTCFVPGNRMKRTCSARLLIVFALVIVGAGHCRALADEQPESAGEQVKTQRLIYKQMPRRTLTVYYPDDWQATDKRPALVIFRCRIPAQREHFRKRGMVIVKPQLAGVNSGRLPVLSLEEIAQQPKPRHQVQDTKSAIRFLRASADELGIDPQRIVATGTSGGGDLALQSYINKSFEDPQDDRSLSPRPDALVLYCPAFDGIDIWFVKTKDFLERTKTDAPSFLPLLTRFVKNTSNEYVVPADHRADLIELAAKLGKEQGIEEPEVARFQQVLEMFNERDWQLLHPVDDALKMSASRILTDEPLPPTLIMYGDRDHLFKYQQAFVAKARSLGQQFQLKVFEGAGHSFMLQPAFQEPSTREVEQFLTELNYLPG